MSGAEIGVLALQGDYVEHQRMLERLGRTSRQIRKASELEGLRALILPGGESTTMVKFMEEEDLMQPLRDFYTSGGALYGTCAGTILMARAISAPSQASLGLMDIDVERNGYGRQIDSHESPGACRELGEEPLPMVFIRAPIISRTGPEVRVLVEHRDQPVLVRQGRLLASTFHPELSNDLRVHRYFLDQVA
ncbi:MAG: pyridoxal 5'-phosphate synthase glutaminase subunit PdxT [Acidobacteria bacterium]|nr:MAG: pyridoxal 5'-phosphate synthase glutaminase subunit PdxT [Acidobacteriota bacterium]